MKLRRNKKGFTIIELVIVIAVIGILAAVLIPTFVNLTNKANEASDNALVNNLNKALRMEEQEPGHQKAPTLEGAIVDLERQGYLLENLATKSGKDLIWSQSENQFLLNTEGKSGKDYWKIVDAVPDNLDNQKYSYYAGKNFNQTDVPAVKYGFDAGRNNGIAKVTYEGTGTAQEVVIRTNGGTLNVGTSEAVAEGKITHYGTLDEAIVYTTNNSFHTHGKIASMDLKAGKAVAEDKGYVALVKASEGTVVEEKDTGVFYIPTNAVVDNIDTTVAASLGYVSNGETTPSYVVDVNTAKGQARTETLANNPYEIHNTEELIAFGRAVNAGQDFTPFVVKVVNDIDVNGQQLEPIGTKAHPFKGVFDGQNHTISNIIVSGIQNYAALFGYVVGEANTLYDSYDDVWTNNTLTETNILESKYTTVIKNVKIANSSFASTKKFAAALIAFGNNVYVYNSTVENTTVSTGKVAGGLIGTINGSIVKNCKSLTNVNVVATGYHAGGLIGAVSYYDADGAYPNPTLPSAVISSESNATLNCVNTAGNGGNYGGLAAIVNACDGNGEASVIYSCKNKGDITLDNTSNSTQYRSQVGGIVGSGQGVAVLANCVNSGSILVKSNFSKSNPNESDRNFVAGIIATMGNETEIYGLYNCENNGNVTVITTTDNHFVGGLVASISPISSFAANIDNCKNTGVISCKNSDEEEAEEKGLVSTLVTNIYTSSGLVVYKNMTFSNLSELSNALPKYVEGYYNSKIKIDSSVAVTNKTGVLEIGYVRRIEAYDGLCSQFKFTGTVPGTSGETRSAYINIPHATLVVDEGQTFPGSVIQLLGDGMGILNNGTFVGGVEVYGSNVNIVNNGTFNAGGGNQITLHASSGTIENNGTFGTNYGVQFKVAGTYTISGANPWVSNNDNLTMTHEGNQYTVTQNN